MNSLVRRLARQAGMLVEQCDPAPSGTVMKVSIYARGQYNPQLFHYNTPVLWQNNYWQNDLKNYSACPTSGQAGQ